jgi:hypothetical protein
MAEALAEGLLNDHDGESGAICAFQGKFARLLGSKRRGASWDSGRWITENSPTLINITWTTRGSFGLQVCAPVVMSARFLVLTREVKLAADLGFAALCTLLRRRPERPGRP